VAGRPVQPVPGLLLAHIAVGSIAVRGLAQITVGRPNK
jgi:hypothetical protein